MRALQDALGERFEGKADFINRTLGKKEMNDFVSSLVDVFGVSSISRSKYALTAVGNRSINRYFAITARHSSTVEVSGSVGPEASTSNLPTGTSETAKVRLRIAPAACASLPPLIAEKCLRTALISAIEPPLCTSAR